MKNLKCIVVIILCCILVFGIFGCTPVQPERPPLPDDAEPNDTPQTQLPVNVEEYTTVEELFLLKGDTYDFAAMKLTIDYIDGETVSSTHNVARAVKIGKSTVYAHSENGSKIRYNVTVVRSVEKLAGRFRLDKGTFNNKKIIVFGDSITDGVLGGADRNYQDTYFSLLCRYLGSSNDPTDIVSSNFACSATTITYGLRKEAGISGVERITEEKISDIHTERTILSNVLDADLCIIFYGTNDFSESVYKDSSKKPQFNDSPADAVNAKTIKGATYYMVSKLLELNENLKILVLPPLYRRDGGHLTYTPDKDDVINNVTGEKLSEYGKVMKEVCDELGAKFIDWYPLFNYENFGNSSVNTVDGLHPNVNGHRMMFEYILQNAN